MLAIMVRLPFYTTEIDAGRPPVVSFLFWNPVDHDIAFLDPDTGETIDVFSWGGAEIIILQTLKSTGLTLYRSRRYRRRI